VYIFLVFITQAYHSARFEKREIKFDTLYSGLQRSVNVPEVMNPTLLKIRGTFYVFGGSVVRVPMTIKRLGRMLRVGTNAWRVSVETSKTVRLQCGLRTGALCQRLW